MRIWAEQAEHGNYPNTRNMFYKGHLIRATLLTSLARVWNLGPSLILQKISRATPGWHSSIIDSFSAPISYNLQQKWLVRQTSCFLRQFWPLPRKSVNSHLHGKQAAVYYVLGQQVRLRVTSYQEFVHARAHWNHSARKIVNKSYDVTRSRTCWPKSCVTLQSLVFSLYSIRLSGVFALLCVLRMLTSWCK